MQIHLPTVIYVSGRVGVFFEQTAINSRDEKRQKYQEYDHYDWRVLNQLQYVPEVAGCR